MLIGYRSRGRNKLDSANIQGVEVPNRTKKSFEHLTVSKDSQHTTCSPYMMARISLTKFPSNDWRDNNHALQTSGDVWLTSVVLR